MQDKMMLVDLSRFSSKGFDRGASVWKEGAWMLVRSFFFLLPFPLPSCCRVWLLRLFGAKVGRGVVIRSRVNVWMPWRLTVGDHVWLGEEVFILNLASVTIESNVCVSQRVFLCAGSHRYDRETFDLEVHPIVLRRGVWVAAQAFVAGGVEIGAETVVSAGSVVLKSLPENSVARGNPAQVIRARYARSAD